MYKLAKISHSMLTMLVFWLEKMPFINLMVKDVFVC